MSSMRLLRQQLPYGADLRCSQERFIWCWPTRRRRIPPRYLSSAFASRSCSRRRCSSRDRRLPPRNPTTGSRGDGRDASAMRRRPREERSSSRCFRSGSSCTTGARGGCAADPKLSLGIAPFTEIELRVPILRVDPGVAGSRAETGVGGLAVGVLRALTIETGALPALAVAADWIAPVGGLAASASSYSGGLFLTKTFTGMRVHLNAAAGHLEHPRSRSPRPDTVSDDHPPPGTVLPPGCTPPPPPDVPCDRIPTAVCRSPAFRAAMPPCAPTLRQRWELSPTRRNSPVHGSWRASASITRLPSPRRC